jgi:predicted methyltransferase
MKFRSLLFAAAALCLGAASASAATPSYVTKAVADPSRPASDTKRDQYYRPETILTFAGLKPGMKVADFLIWDGYFTRLFSDIVGPKGFVYAYYVTEEDKVRPKTGDRVGQDLEALKNVGIIHASTAQFVTPEPVDMVWIGWSYHDLHNTKLFKGLDIAAVNKAIFASLKHGGTYVVLDRAAKPGTGLQGARIEEQLVRSEIEAAGFQFVASSKAVRDPSDDYTKKAGKANYDVVTDEFLMKFRKP